jgi:hypothetical protein
VPTGCIVIEGAVPAGATVTLAVPLTTPFDAVTVYGPPTVLAVNNPAVLIVPPPDTDHPYAALIA